jgi:hypothetical protein
VSTSTRFFLRSVAAIPFSRAGSGTLRRLAPNHFHSYCGAVKNITVGIGDEIYFKARRKAASLDTSVSQVVADFLRNWTTEEASKKSRTKKLRKLFALVANRSQPGPAAPGPRDDLYASRIR